MLDFGFYNMDCNVALPEFPDNYFDLAVVDPPYGIKVFAKDNATRSKLATSKSYKEYAGGDQVAPDPEYFAQLKRISKNQIIFGANHFMDNIVAGFGGVSSPCWIVWDKQNGQNDFADGGTCLHVISDSRSDIPFHMGGYAAGEHEGKGNPHTSDTKACRPLRMDIRKLYAARAKDNRYTRRIRVVPDSGTQGGTAVRWF